MRAKTIMTLGYADGILEAGSIIENYDDAIRLIADGVAIAIEDTAPVPEKKAEKPPVRDAKAK